MPEYPLNWNPLTSDDLEVWRRTCDPLPADARWCGPDSAVGEEARLLSESFRWGEPSMAWEDDEHLMLGVAASVNQQFAGGVILRGLQVGEGIAPGLTTRLRALGWRLFDLLAERNLVNTALMRSRRGQGEVERLRAEAIHDWKLEQSGVLRQGFVHLEPELVLAIRRGDRPEARRILNALLMHIFNASRGELSRVTGLIAELLALMRITVRDCGVTVEEAAMFREPVMETLTRMRDEEELSPWLHQQLEGWMDLVASSAARPAALRARLILDYIARNASRPLGRAEVASKAGLSEAEFSRMLRRVTGRSFSEHLLKLRIDQACSLLRSSGLTLEEISGRCGFESASYFSRRFRQETGISPSQYRKNLFAEVDRGQPE